MSNDIPLTAPAQKPGENKPTYLHPYACFTCRKSFKRSSRTAAVLKCPNCGGPSIGLTRKFKPPKASDIDQWRKVEALVRSGFLFWPMPERYPETLAEVKSFTERHSELLAEERARNPKAYIEIAEALSSNS